jgi:hypothetical protein
VKVSTAFVDLGLLNENNTTVAIAKAEERMIFFIFVVLNFKICLKLKNNKIGPFLFNLMLNKE